MTKHGSLILCGLALALTACTDTKFTIDNPTDQPVTVGIDGKQHTVPAHAEESVSIAPGKHAFESPATGKVDIIVYAKNKGALINPTLADYVVANEIYATNAKTAKGFMKLENTIVIGDELFKGPFRIHRGLFIEQDWTYGVHEEFADAITVGSDAKGNLVGKIFTAPDFVSFYRRRYGVPEKLATASAPVARQAVTPPEPLPHFANPEIEKASMPIREQYAKYLVATDPAEQKTLQEGTSKTLTDFITVVAPLMSTNTSEENQKHNDFISAYGHVFGVSARVMTP